MIVLIACEESQEVCKAFRVLGHEAYSCDLQEPSGGHPEWHILGDALVSIEGGRLSTMDGQVHDIPKWDLIIAHPPCTKTSNAGAKHLWRGHKLNIQRYYEGMCGKALFMTMLAANCDKIAVENPMPSAIFQFPAPTQIIQPYEYGHPYSKKTYLWLKGLPPLQPTEIVENHVPYVTSGSYSKGHDPKYKGASRRGGSSKMRSKTFSGIAKAMAEQWGSL